MGSKDRKKTKKGKEEKGKRDEAPIVIFGYAIGALPVGSIDDHVGLHAPTMTHQTITDHSSRPRTSETRPVLLVLQLANSSSTHH